MKPLLCIITVYKQLIFNSLSESYPILTRAYLVRLGGVDVYYYRRLFTNLHSVTFLLSKKVKNQHYSFYLKDWQLVIDQAAELSEL